LDLPLEYLWLLPLGFVIGAFGTLIGAGGGFILVPILLLLYPHETTELITSISLAVVFLNALSGSFAYSLMKRIDYKSGIIFSIATIPGAVLGALATPYVPRRTFDLVFGILMVLASALLWFAAEQSHSLNLYRNRDQSFGKRRSRMTLRTLIDVDGARYEYEYNPVLGIALSLCVGFLSSLLGIGGGFIHVPAMARLLDFPVHVATATSQFVLVITALTGTVVHILQGVFVHGLRRTAILGIGVIVGAQVGAWISARVGGKMIIRGLAVALVLVGLRLIISEF
jgi:uncharacterized membrane protein YfcA